MTGKELENFLYLNGISQKEAADYLGVERQTINNWCNKSELSGKILTKANSIIDHFSQGKSVKSSIVNAANGVILSGNNSTGNIDNRQYYSDSPDVLRAQIDILDERIKEKDAQIKEKDAQIKEKDAQINRLLRIIETSVAGENGQK